MRIAEIIDKMFYLNELPLELTENSPKKWVRVIGVLWFAVWFFPCMFLFLIVGGILCIPAMIQDA